jgi:predicted transglutaminase-like cysteine proteinase
VRLFAPLVVALAVLFATPAVAKCPPLTGAQIVHEQKLEKAEARYFARPPEVTGITVYPVNSLCRVKPKSLICAGGLGTRLTLAQVNAIDTVFRNEFEYRSDELQFGDDVYQDNTVCGDCEDYALTLARRLNAGGQGGTFMALMIWSPYRGAAHATLIVETADAGVVEIGTGPAASEGAHPFDASRGKRFGFIVLDGSARSRCSPATCSTSSAP